MLEGCVLEVTGESSAGAQRWGCPQRGAALCHLTACTQRLLPACTRAGKTQLCHMAAATTALGGRAVAYVDTTNSFSAPRLAQMLVGMQVSACS